MKTFSHYIDGTWTPAVNRQTRPAVNPATGETFAHLAWGGREDAQAAIAAANRAQNEWRKIPLFERCAVVEGLASALERRQNDLAEILCTELGKPRQGEAKDEAAEVPANFRIAPQQARYLEGKTYPVQSPAMRVMSFRRPLGVIGIITPWNFPAAIPCEYIPYALVMGNAVVWTPAPTAAATAVVLMEILHEAGLPKGLVNLVIGPGQEVGDEIVVNSGTHAIGMTGSPSTGLMISSRCGLKPRLFELGGNGPIVVLDDADPEKAAQAIAPACFYAAGQVCSSAERIFVAESLRSRFVAAMVEESKNWRIGDPRDPAVNVGPLNNPAVREKVMAHIADAQNKGSRVAIGGTSPDRPGNFFAPTVLDGFAIDSRINLEETFGPVAPIAGFRTEEEAWRMIQSCPLGLVAAVFTKDIDRAWTWAENLPAGLTVVNEFTNYWEYHLPFGGRAGTQSSVGRLGGKETLRFMSEIQTLAFRVDEKF